MFLLHTLLFYTVAYECNYFAMASNADSMSFAEAFANGQLVEKFNNHFGESQRLDSQFFQNSDYKRYFAHVLLGIATSLILSEECRKFGFEHLYRTADDDMVRIILTKNGNKALIHTFFMGSTDLESMKTHNKAEYIHHFNNEIRFISGLATSADEIDVSLKSKELMDLKMLVSEKERKNLDNYNLEYKTYEISRPMSNERVKMRFLEHWSEIKHNSKSARVTPNFSLSNYVHANLGSNAIKIFTKHLLNVMKNEPNDVVHVRQLFHTIALLSMNDAHLLTKQTFENIPHISYSEIGQAGFFHGALESLKPLLPFSHVSMKRTPYLLYNGQAWSSDLIEYRKNALLNYADQGEPEYSPINTAKRAVEQFTQHPTDGMMYQGMNPVLYLKANDMKHQPIIVTFQHKTYPTVNEVSKQGIRNDVIFVSLRSNVDHWISVLKFSIRLRTMFSRYPFDGYMLLDHLKHSLQAHLNLASFKPENPVRYLALSILGYLQTPKSDFVHIAEPKPHTQDASLLNLAIWNNYRKIVCIRFHDGSIPPIALGHNEEPVESKKLAVIVDVVNDGGSVLLRESIASTDDLIKHFILRPVIKTRLRENLFKYAHNHHEKHAESVRDELSTLMSMHNQYLKSQDDLHAFLDGYSLYPDTVIGLKNRDGEYSIGMKVPLKPKKWYSLSKREPEIEDVNLRFAYEPDSNSAGRALGNLESAIRLFRAENSEASLKSGIFSIVLSKEDEISIACQRWACNTRNVKTFVCGQYARKKRSASICSADHKYDIKAKDFHMKKVSKIAHGIQSGFMVRDIVADLVNKDYKSLALTSGLLASSGLSGYIGGKLRSLGTSAAISAGSCMANIPFMAYNAVDAYRSFHDNDKVTAYTDLAMIGIDSLCLADGLLYASGLAASVPVLGEVGLALSTVVLLSSNIYSAYKTVQNLNTHLQLSSLETFTEGIRAFLHMNPEPLVDHLIKGKRADEFIVQQSISNSELSRGFKYYITAAGSDFDQNGNLIYRLDNFVDLRQVVHRYTKSRMMPNGVSDANTFCIMDATESESSKVATMFNWVSTIFTRRHGFEDYYCNNSFGIKFKSYQSSELALYDLFDGHDTIYGFKNVTNIFRVGSGTKKITGGDLDDVLFVNGNQPIQGSFSGFSGRNAIDLTKYAVQSRIYITKSQFQTAASHKVLFSNVTDFIGREAAPETINVTCEFKSIDTKGGTEHDSDEIYISEDTCSYDLNLKVRENTIINSIARHGNVTFILHHNGYANISISKTVDAIYTFYYQNTSLWNVSFQVLLNKRLHLILNINTDFGGTNIKTMHKKFTVCFLDAVLLWNENRAMVYVDSTLPLKILLQRSLNLCRATGISVTAFSQESNETLVMLAAGSQNETLVMSIDGSRKNHISSLHRGKNVLRVITPSNFTVYLSLNQTMTIDMHHFSHDMLVNNGQEISMKAERQDFVDDFSVKIHIYINHLTYDKVSHVMSISILAEDQICFDNFIIQSYASYSLKIRTDEIKLIPNDINIFYKSLIYISSFTVETNSRLIIHKNATDFKYYRLNKMLIMSNIDSITTHDYVTIFLEEYLIYRKKFSSLTFDFLTDRESLKVPDVENLMAEVEEWNFHINFDSFDDRNSAADDDILNFE